VVSGDSGWFWVILDDSGSFLLFIIATKNSIIKEHFSHIFQESNNFLLLELLNYLHTITSSSNCSNMSSSPTIFRFCIDVCTMPKKPMHTLKTSNYVNIDIDNL